MSRKLPYTPNSQIKAATRRLWLRSRERASAIKRDKYTCQRCHVKQSKAKGKEFKVEVHHRQGIENWQEVYRVIREYVLTDIEHLETLCPECHKKEADK